MFTRRDFIKTMSLLSGAVLAPVHWLGKWAGVQPAETNEPPDVGELYAGFVLLPDGAEIPDFVINPLKEMPILCGVGFDRGGPKPTASTKCYSSLDDLFEKVDFPLYSLTTLSADLRPVGGCLIRRDSGEIYLASVNYETNNNERNFWEGTVHISATPDFPKPFPLWASEPKEPGGPEIVLEKVDFLPSPGIMVLSGGGYVFYWIQNNIFYTFYAENGASYEDAQKLTSSLVSL